jgi:iron complex transport system ATP-binding protein
MSAIIQVENLSFGYTQDTILKALSFEVTQGQFLAIAGPNGAGKTTLLNLLCGLLRPKTGSIKIDAARIESYSTKKLAQKVAVVRQEFVPVFDFTVTEMVSMARTPYLGTFGFESKMDRKFVNEALEMTDTVPFASRPLGKLSGGERQRVFIARALAQDAAILLLDEPTSFLDLKHQVGIYDLLKKMQLEKGKTIIAVTHDINLTIQYCDEILLLGADSSYCIGKCEDVFSPAQIKKVFGVRTFVGKVGREKFFLPLGKFAKDNQIVTDKPAGNQQK